jgi:hypothetical protein
VRGTPLPSFRAMRRDRANFPVDSAGMVESPLSARQQRWAQSNNSQVSVAGLGRWDGNKCRWSSHK